MDFKLNDQQCKELTEKLAQEIVDNITEKTAASDEGQQEQLTEDQIKAIIASKKKEIAERQNEEGVNEQPTSNTEPEKAAMVYQNALDKIAACEKMYIDGEIQKQACIEVLAEAGLYDENGLNKEAAEYSDETIYFTNKVAESYDDSEEKIAAAQECYDEAVEHLNAAKEVLAQYGYTV